MESLPEQNERKRLDKNKDNKDILGNIELSTNLKKVNLKENAIKDVFLYGCDIKQVLPISDDFNKVNIMRKARRVNCFKDEIKKYIKDFYISGLILMGRPILVEDQDNTQFFFYLRMKEKEGKNEIEYEIVEEPKIEGNPDDQTFSTKVYKFIFIRKKNLLEYNQKLNESQGDSSLSSFLSSYLNICLGKLLKKIDYYKDRTTRKILYYKKNDIAQAIPIGSQMLFFPALKAVCETYDENKIYMKLLPKKILISRFTYDNYFEEFMNRENVTDDQSFQKALEKFRVDMKYRRGIKIYNQEITKIEDIIYKNPYNVKFTDKNQKKTNVGDYLSRILNRPLEKEDMPIAVRYIDQGGKLKGDARIPLYIPLRLLEIIGNVFGDKIDIRKLVQNPTDKYYEINDINNELIKAAQETGKQDENELSNCLGKKFENVYAEGHVLNPPIILFGNHKEVDTKNGSISLLRTEPFSKVKELKNVDVYILDLYEENGGIIWDKLLEASHELGIKLPKDPFVYTLPEGKNSNFKENLEQFFADKNNKYTSKENKTDFIFLFMSSQYKNKPYYKDFKSTINKFDWKIPTQVILYDDKKFDRKDNLSQFTNILCQIWAKMGNELYSCNFDFVPNTIVIAYSSMNIKNKNKRQVLTSLTISIGTKLFEYLFYSDICDEDIGFGSRISPSIKKLLINALTTVGKYIKKNIENIIIYRDAVNEKQIALIEEEEIPKIKEAIQEANSKLEEGKRYFTNTKCCLILASKISEVKIFMEYYEENTDEPFIENVPVGTLVDRKVTSHNYFDFYLNSADSRQGTCSPTHYTVIFDNTELKAIQIYKVTYYLSYLSYNTTKCIKLPAPLYFVTRRNNFTRDNLKGEIINPKSRILNISL